LTAKRWGSTEATRGVPSLGRGLGRGLCPLTALPGERILEFFEFSSKKCRGLTCGEKAGQWGCLIDPLGAEGVKCMGV